MKGKHIVSVSLKAYAKINIGLDITGKREDGYHLLKSVMQQVDLYDVITLDKCEDNVVTLKTNSADIPTDDSNIAVKAAKLMMSEYDIKGGVVIDIQKNIPVAAGMAGGSTDAAAVIKGINELYELSLDDKTLRELGVRIGADVPFCIQGGCALCEGIGEKLTKIYSDIDMYVLIVKPALNVSTKHVYQNLHLDSVVHPDMETVLDGYSESNIHLITEYMGNVLESVTANEHDVINILKNEIKDTWANGSLMSGSGPTVFGIYEDMEHAKKAEDHMKKLHPDMFVKAVGIIK